MAVQYFEIFTFEVLFRILVMYFRYRYLLCCRKVVLILILRAYKPVLRIRIHLLRIRIRPIRLKIEYEDGSGGVD